MLPPEAIIPVAEWLAKGKALFGGDHLQWKFRCPICGHVQTMSDFQALKVEPQSAYRVCIGRYLPEDQRASGLATMPAKNGQKSPCDYAAYGLFQIGIRVLVEGQGKPLTVFPFAEESGKDAAA